MKLLIQPGDGVVPIIKGINSAKKSVEIAIFRFDRSEIETALSARSNAIRPGEAHFRRSFTFNWQIATATCAALILVVGAFWFFQHQRPRLEHQSRSELARQRLDAKPVAGQVRESACLQEHHAVRGCVSGQWTLDTVGWLCSVLGRVSP